MPLLTTQVCLANHYLFLADIFWKAGVKTGPVTGQPPPVSSETTAALLGASNSDPIRQHDGGQDGGDTSEGKKIKSEKECMDSS